MRTNSPIAGRGADIRAGLSLREVPQTCCMPLHCQSLLTLRKSQASRRRSVKNLVDALTFKIDRGKTLGLAIVRTGLDFVLAFDLSGQCQFALRAVFLCVLRQRTVSSLSRVSPCGVDTAMPQHLADFS